MSNHNFKKYLVRQMTDKGAVLVSEIEIAEGSLSELLEENRIVKPDDISVVQPEPIDPKMIESFPAFHKELTQIAAANGGIFPAPPPRKPALLDKIKEFFR